MLIIDHSFVDAYLWADDFGWMTNGQTFDPAWSFGFLHRTHFYRPLIELYFDLEVWLFGYAPRALHASNIAIHILNAWLVYALARRLLQSIGAACAAAIFFVVLPVTVDAVAWVSAATALLMTGCYLAAMLAHLVWLETRQPLARAATVMAFVAALMAHEGAVTLLPMMLLAQCLSGRPLPRVGDMVRHYAPFAAVLALFLVIAVVVNRTNHVVTEGEYRIGVHAVGTILGYVTAMYVGRHGTLGILTSVALLMLVAFRGTNPARFGAAWMLLALVPYSFFVTAGGSRYAYLPSVGFALLLAAVMQSFWRALTRRAGMRFATSVATVLTAVIAGRFAVFALQRGPLAAEPGEPYRAWVESFRRTRGTLSRGATVRIETPLPRGVEPQAVPLLLRLEYGDPTLRVEIDAN